MLRTIPLAVLATTALTTSASFAATWELVNIYDPTAGVTQFGNSVSIHGDDLVVGNADNVEGAQLFDAESFADLREFTSSDTEVTVQPSAAVAQNSSQVASMGSKLYEDPAKEGNRNSTAPYERVFIFDKASGVQQLELGAPDFSDHSDGFGTAIALSENRALVGARFTDKNGVDRAGAAYLYDLADGSLIAELDKTLDPAFGSANTNERFGDAVAINSTTAAVGAFRDDDFGGNQAGAVYLFDALTGGFELSFGDPNSRSNGYFGEALAMTETGLLVGASGGAGTGFAYYYDLATLLAGDTNPLYSFDLSMTDLLGDDLTDSDNFGRSVALTDEYAFVSAEITRSLGADGIRMDGNVFAFDLSDGSFVETLDFSPFDKSLDFGTSLSAFGDTLVVGTANGGSGEVLQFELAAVPLPAPLALLAGGIGVLAMARRRG
ncbi:MAG: FG-GAP repeat protein [Mangrovicoccus sp.]